MDDFNRRFSLPFEEEIQGRAQVHYAATLDRCVIIAPSGNVKIGAAHLEQCVIIEPCTIADNVVAVGAILQGDIGFGCHIEAHADIQGTLEEYVRVERGVRVRLQAYVGQNSHLLDRCIIEERAEIGANAEIGIEAVVREGARVRDNARVPARAQIPAHGYWDPTDARQRPPGDAVRLRLVEPEDPDENEYDEDEDDDRILYDDDGPEEFELEGPWQGGGKMVRGRPSRELEDFNPGSSRSWALTKLARIAALEGPYGRIDKKLIREHRPDLLDHPVTQEALRVQPPMTATQLNEKSWLALSKAHYDVYTGVKFHSGPERDWQMIGPKPNDVFVLAVPVRVMKEISERTGADVEDMRQRLFGEDKSDWHPDQDVPFAIGWVRTLLYPRVLMVVVEVQSDRSWMKFNWNPKMYDRAFSNYIDDRYEYEYDPDPEWQAGVQSEAEKRFGGIGPAARMLRDLYFDSFASDAINMVVEWAFSNRYREVFILDQKSRKKLGGTPPKDYYDTVPKQYTKLGLSPLPGWVETYDWVPGNLKGRSIRPNTSDGS